LTKLLHKEDLNSSFFCLASFVLHWVWVTYRWWRCAMPRVNSSFVDLVSHFLTFRCAKLFTSPP
jgi:hypothetical protein